MHGKKRWKSNKRVVCNGKECKSNGTSTANESFFLRRRQTANVEKRKKDKKKKQLAALNYYNR
jgi:hypothetical protein